MRKQYCNKVAWLISLVLAAVLVSGSTEASWPLPEQLNAESKVEIVGDLQVGKPFEVVFTFMPLDTIIHPDGIHDSAYIRSHKGVRWLGGDTIWIGQAEYGKANGLRAQYMVDSAQEVAFRGVLVTMHTLGKPKPAGEKFDRGIRAERSASSGWMTIGELKGEEFGPTRMGKDQNIVISKFSLDPESVGLLPFRGETVIAKMPDSTLSKRIFEVENRFDKDTTGTMIIELKSSQDTTIFVHPKKSNLLRLSPRFKGARAIEKAGVELKRMREDLYEINLRDSTGVIIIEYNGHSLQVVVKYLSVYNICGHATFVDNNGVQKDAKEIYVGLYSCLDDECNSVTQAGYTYTGPWDGQFCFYADNPVVIVAMFSSNDVTTVCHTDDSTYDIGAMLHPYLDGVMINNPAFNDICIPV